MEKVMLAQLSRNWWAVALRGIIAILFGLTAIVWPRSTLVILVLIFGAYMLVDGIFAIVAAFSYRAGYPSWWVLLLEGLMGIAAGIIVFASPALTTILLIYLISFWAIVTGIMEIFAAIQLRKEILGEWMLALSGIVSLVLGILLLLFPVWGEVTIAWLIGVYAILFGAMLLGLGLRLRKLGAHYKTSAVVT
jgi:uncharacterized membrane protein HdeD (DUF308 family)